MTTLTIDVLTQLQQRIFDINESKGFHEDRPKPMRPGSTLAGISERNQRLDFAATEGFNLAEIILEKIAHNETRPYKHGKNF